MKDMKYIDIQYTLDEISLLSVNKFRNIVKIKINKIALEYLLNCRKSKGKQIIYNKLEMAEYLLPNKHLNIDQQIYIFNIRNRMIHIYSNFSKNELFCLTNCGNIESMEHIYNCEKLCGTNIISKLNYEKIYSSYIKDQIEVYLLMKKNIELYELLQVNHS